MPQMTWSNAKESHVTNPVTLVEAGEHPAELRRPEPAPGTVRDEIRLVVPGQEAAAEGGKEDEAGQTGDGEGDQHAGGPRFRRPRRGPHRRAAHAEQESLSPSRAARAVPRDPPARASTGRPSAGEAPWRAPCFPPPRSSRRAPRGRPRPP